ncbi:uncharacterized protein LOC133707166 [Rosa rugosa]|uniref:uncharacterized protein LOC133707166 n=1 Tax=Rosa rugosa TaxID=74645 RepID=UPI002B400C11|nr:uncharacterized protein LOC133707166 [Rosa rugosa]XP_061988711.1 uncharacterized protein LOC133707166 [Rosa rugosa]XP_061988712.1 uncharacterized protein LOC133707166 [Rosa rugosa]XP_061988713.1 uncharacterized protein LOC133707166 [Rosa rugosa]
MNFYDHITLGNCSPLEAKQKILGEVIKLGHKIFVSMEFEEESELERQLQMVRGECDDAKLKISSLTKEASTLKKKLEKQTKELEDRDANLVLAQASLVSAEEEVQRLKKEIEDVAARKDQERAEALEKEREEARSNQSMRNSLSGAIDIFERNLAEEKNQTGPLNEELSRLYKLACDTLFQYFMDKGVIDKKVLLALQGEEKKKKYDQLKAAAKDRASSQAPSGADSGEADVSEEEDDSGTQTTNTTTVTTFTFDITPSTQLPVTPSLTPQTGYSLDIDS